MLSPVLLLLATQGSPFTVAPVVPEPKRLMRTPTIDGKMDANEWDELYTANGMTAYLQYEPRKLYIAAKIAAGQDVLVSIDQKSNGWLQGFDNVEIRLHMNQGKPEVQVRELDGTLKEGPRWVDSSGFSASSVAAASADGTFVEAMIVDPGVDSLTLKRLDKPSVRFDAIASDAPSPEPFLPRVLAQIDLNDTRGVALPATLEAKVEDGGRVIQPGDATKFKLQFKGSDSLGIKRITMSGDGPAKDLMSLVEQPFPPFNAKKYAGVDFPTVLAATAPEGYHWAKATLTMASGPEAAVQWSFRSAPLVDFELVPVEIKSKEYDETYKIPFYIRSNSPRRLDGTYKIELPAGWIVKAGGEGSFLIYNSRANTRKVLTVVVPRKATGPFPIKVTVKVGKKTVEQQDWLTIFG